MKGIKKEEGKALCVETRKKWMKNEKGEKGNGSLFNAVNLE